MEVLLAGLAGIVILAYVLGTVFGRRPGQDTICWMHRDDIVRDTYIHEYRRCRRCGGRQIRVVGRGSQPVDTHWLKTGEWRKTRPPNP